MKPSKFLRNKRIYLNFCYFYHQSFHNNFWQKSWWWFQF